MSKRKASGRRVVVVGGGISGLTTGFWLDKNGVRATVLEQEDYPGGTIRTERTEGFLMDLGANSALETTPLIGQLLEETHLKDEQCYANEVSNRRYVLRDGRLSRLPMSPPAFIRTKLFSPKAKLRLLAEPFIGRSNNARDESVAQFVIRRLGQEFLDYAINPFVAGVYAGDPERLSVRSAFPKLYGLEEKYGSLIRGFIGGRKERKKQAEISKQSARLFSFKQGMETLPRALARELRDRVMLKSRVVGLRTEDSGSRYLIDVERGGGAFTLEAEAVVLAIPAYAAAALIEPLDRQTAQVLKDIDYPPVAVVFTGFKSEKLRHPLDGFGFLVPAKEKRHILGTIWSSTIFPNRAPEGYAALTTFVGGARQPELAGKSDDHLLNLVLKDLTTILGLEGKPDFVRIVRWSRAIPQYSLGYWKVTQSIDQLEAQFPGLYICSNYRGGIAVGDCIMNAAKTVQRILARVAQPESAPPV